MPYSQASAATTSNPTSFPPLPLVAANVYISEGRRPGVLDEIVRAIAGTGAVVTPTATPWRVGEGGGSRPHVRPSIAPSVALLHAFPDAAYNRTGFTLVGMVGDSQASNSSSTRSRSSSACGLTAAIVAAAQAGLAHVDLAALRGHGGGDHPTLGIVDHIAVHPLGGAGSSLGDAVCVARAVAAALGAPGPASVPAFLYGAAAVDPAHSSLAALRRALGYFRPPLAPGGAGGGGGGDESGFPAPDFGPAPGCSSTAAVAARGRVAVGATPWVLNWNVPLGGCDEAAASAIARTISSRGGGALPGVEALALRHEEEEAGSGGSAFAWEVATNLRDPGASPPAAVEALIAAVAARLGGGKVVVGAGYSTGRDPEVLAEAARQALVVGG